MTEQRGHSINTGGGAYIGGSVKVGSDIVGRDKVVTAGERGVTVGGDVTGGTTITGSGNMLTSQQGVTLEQFRSLLTEMRDLLSQTGLEKRKARIIEGDLVAVEEETKEAKPDKAIIASKLEGVTRVLKAVGNLTDAGNQLLLLAGKGLSWLSGLAL